MLSEELWYYIVTFLGYRDSLALSLTCKSLVGNVNKLEHVYDPGSPSSIPFGLYCLTILDFDLRDIIRFTNVMLILTKNCDLGKLVLMANSGYFFQVVNDIGMPLLRDVVLWNYLFVLEYKPNTELSLHNLTMINSGFNIRPTIQLNLNELTLIDTPLPGCLITCNRLNFIHNDDSQHVFLNHDLNTKHVTVTINSEICERIGLRFGGIKTGGTLEIITRSRKSCVILNGKYEHLSQIIVNAHILKFTTVQQLQHLKLNRRMIQSSLKRNQQLAYTLEMFE